MSVDNVSQVSQFLRLIHAVSSPKDCAAIYNDWAKTYDIDVRHEGIKYVGPVLAAQAIVAANGNIASPILDAGCGTGLVGVALREAGATHIDGIDISPGMLEVARKTGAYRDLTVVDMSTSILKRDESYDVVTCVGTFTEGHVGPVPALQELVRITKKDGLFVSTIVDEVWVSGGYEAEVNRLEATGSVDILGTENADYRRGTNMKARMVILRRR